MRRFLLDTGIAGDFIDRRHRVYERAREEVAKGNRIGIGIPVLAELAYGIELSKSRDRNMQSLRTAMAAWKVWPFDEAAAFEYVAPRGGVAADRASNANGGHHDRRHRPVSRQLHGGVGGQRSGGGSGAGGRELGDLGGTRYAWRLPSGNRQLLRRSAASRSPPGSCKRASRSRGASRAFVSLT